MLFEPLIKGGRRDSKYLPAAHRVEFHYSRRYDQSCPLIIAMLLLNSRQSVIDLCTENDELSGRDSSRIISNRSDAEISFYRKLAIILAIITVPSSFYNNSIMIYYDSNN